MNGLTGLRFALLLTVWASTWPTAEAAQTTPVLPSPLSLGDVIRLASERRDEIQAPRARTRAGEARPTIVSGLSGPHVFALARSPTLHAGAARTSASRLNNRFPCPAFAGTAAHPPWRMSIHCALKVSRTTLDVLLQAVNAFLVVQERRRTEALVSEQLSFSPATWSAPPMPATPVGPRLRASTLPPGRSRRLRSGSLRGP